jgi:hypothetical protein
MQEYHWYYKMKPLPVIIADDLQEYVSTSAVITNSGKTMPQHRCQMSFHIMYNICL